MKNQLLLLRNYLISGLLLICEQTKAKKMQNLPDHQYSDFMEDPSDLGFSVDIRMPV